MTESTTALPRDENLALVIVIYGLYIASLPGLPRRPWSASSWRTWL